MSEPIISRQNPAVVHITKLLTQSKYRREAKLFAAEGTKLLSDALAAGVQVTEAYLPQSAAQSLPEAVSVHILADRLFEQISTQKTPQGAIFAARRPSPPPPRGKLIVLDGVQDPGNVGAIIRTAAALGLNGVLLTGGCADPYSHKAVRASMGGVFRVPVSECTAAELPSLIGERVLAAAAPDTERTVTGTDWTDCIPVIGSEGRGISAEVLALCKQKFTIPMQNDTESLNAAIAAAIIMWEMTGKE